MRVNAVVIFTLFISALFAFAVYDAIDFPFAGRLFPLLIGIPALILTLIQLVLDLRAQLKPDKDSVQDFVDVAPDKDIPASVVRARGIRFLSWLLGLHLGIWLVGFKISVPLFFICFLRFEGKARWPLIIGLTAISVYIIFHYFEELLGVFWPKPLLSRWVDIPFLL